ncbi:MAG: hypothetical protein AABZ44_02030 [Elusimicrobiota bacterium]
MKKSIAALIIMVPCTIFAGEPQRLAGRFGIALGAPTGLTGDLQIDRSNRGFADLGVISDALALNAGWEHHFPPVFEPKDHRLGMVSLLGLGVHAHLTDKSQVGIGPVLAEELYFKDRPFFVFVRLFPYLRMFPSSGFNVNATLGLTFGF